MGLDVFELIVHDHLYLWRGGNVLTEQGWVVFKGVSFNLSDDAAPFGNVFLQFTA